MARCRRRRVSRVRRRNSHAQHTLAAKFDLTKPLTLTGTVTQIDWANPYVHMLMKVPRRQPLPALWAVEVEGPIDADRQRLERVVAARWRGDPRRRVRARDGSKQISGKSVVITRTSRPVYVGTNGTPQAAADGDGADTAVAGRPARDSVRRPVRPATGDIRAAAASSKTASP